MNRKTWLPMLGRLEDPFSKNPDPKASILMVLFPMMSMGIMAFFILGDLAGYNGH